MIPVLCYASMWLFARFGGEWASTWDLPIPDGSQFLASQYVTYYPNMGKQSLYIYADEPENIRQWYIESGFSITPLALNLENTSFIDYDDYFGTPGLPSAYRSGTLPKQLHRLAVWLTSRWWEETLSYCENIEIYKQVGATVPDFPDISIPADHTAIVLITCWPDVASQY